METNRRNSEFKSHPRVRRHNNFIATDIGVRCYRPSNVGDEEDDACDYIRETHPCHVIVRLFDYLDFAVCSLKLETIGSWAYVCFCIALLSFYILVLFIVAKWFIAPNVETLYKRLQIHAYRFGLIIVAGLFVVPNCIKHLLLFEKPTEEVTLLLSEFASQTMTLLALGFAIVYSHAHFHMKKLRFLFNMLIIVFCNLYVFILLTTKTELENKPADERQDMNLNIHAILLVLIYCSYLLYNIIMIVWFDVREEDQTATMQNPDQYIEILPPLQQDERTNKPTTRRSSQSQKSILSPFFRWLRPPSVDQSANQAPDIASENEQQPTISVWDASLNALRPSENLNIDHVVLRWMVAPIWLVLTIFIPVLDSQRDLGGWCKYLICLNFLLAPIITLPLQLPNAYFLLLAICIVVVIVIASTTDHAVAPNNFEFFSIFGLLVAFSVVEVVSPEIDTILHQMLQYVSDLDRDAVAIVTYAVSYSVATMTICMTLIKRKRTRIAFGLIIGVSLYNSFAGFPIIIYEANAKEEENERICITAHTATVYIFLLLMLGMIILSALSTNFRFRTSMGIYLLLYFAIFWIFTALSIEDIIHPYGTKHAILTIKDNHHSNWA